VSYFIGVSFDLALNLLQDLVYSCPVQTHLAPYLAITPPHRTQCQDGFLQFRFIGIPQTRRGRGKNGHEFGMKVSPHKKRRLKFTRQNCFMLSVELMVLLLVIWRLSGINWPGGKEPTAQHGTPIPPVLTSSDVLPTPTLDPVSSMRMITFPRISAGAPIIPAQLSNGTWETRHLGGSVGHLAGTSWLDDPGGNIVWLVM
jgi:hypothetical protein